MADSLDVAEINKMRAALGMSLLPTGAASASTNMEFKQASTEEDLGSTLDTREAAGFDNWKKVQDDAAEKKRREAKREALKKERDAAQRVAKLEGQGLGDAPDGEGVDTKSWLLGQAKRQKKIAKARQRQMEQELIERENQAQYTEQDLAGMKVGHELGDFEAGSEQIITLKDRAVDDEDEEDVLENAQLRDQEKLQARLDLKKKKPVYDPNEVEESGERKLLAQYDDDEVDGSKQKKFTLNGAGRTIEELAHEAEDTNLKSRGMKFSLDALMEDKPAVSDYMDISEIKIKKPKKKKDKAKKQKAAEDMFDIPEAPAPARDAMQLDVPAPDTPSEAPTTNKRRFGNDLVIDDDDLQSQLAASRRAALKKRKMTRPEDIARQVREEASMTPMETETPEEEGGLVIDETSEFVANLQKPEAVVKSAIKQEVATPTPQPTVEQDPDSDADADVEMEGQAYADEAEAQAAIQAQLNSTATTNNLTATGLDDEGTITNGLGATLAMLTQRGLLKTAGSGDLNAQHRDRQRFLAERQNHEAAQAAKVRAQRERDRASGKFDRMSVKEREQYAQWENKNRDQQDSRQVAEIFNKEYKPNVELKYVDEHGRRMNQKEAFKFLSHQFHGKGSGASKTDKRLKKFEEEKKREGKAMLDASGESGMTGVAGVQSKKNRQAGVRLQ